MKLLICIESLAMEFICNVLKLKEYLTLQISASLLSKTASFRKAHYCKHGL